MTNKERLKKEYSRNMKRIKSFIRSAEKRGYYFNENILPAKPKIITEGTIRKLQKINPDYLYKKAVYAGELTYGEIVPAARGRYLERKASSEKAAKTVKERKKQQKLQHPDKIMDSVPQPPSQTPSGIAPADFWAEAVITEFINRARSYVGGGTGIRSTQLEQLINVLLQDYSTEEVAEMLESAANDGVELTYMSLYDKEQYNAYIAALLDRLPDASAITTAAILDQFEESQIWSE